MIPRLAVLLSGSGSTLQNLIDRVADGRLAASIVGVVSSRANVRGVERARTAGIPVTIVPPSPGGSGFVPPSPLTPLPPGEGGTSKDTIQLPPGEGGTSKDNIPTLRRVISAGAPATPAVLERFVQLLPPGVQVFTPYGATEALPVSNIGSDEILTETRHLTDQGKGVCVGRPVNGVTVHVIPISDEPIPTWDDSLQLPRNQVGEFVIRGPIVTTRYFHRDDATKLAKMYDPTTGETLHRMGDVGYIDDIGRMWFAGRKSHRVETPHGTLFTDLVEPMFNMPGVRTALVGIRRNETTYAALVVELEDLAAKERDWPAILHCFRGILQTDAYRHLGGLQLFLLSSRRFPVDVRHNSKIFREQLAAWADKEIEPNWAPWKPPETPS